jgi:multiple sugar transport system permease protein
VALRVCAAGVAGFLLLQLTLAEIDLAIAEAREAGASLPVWSQIILISAGAALIGLAWWLWQRTVQDQDDRGFIVKVLVVILAVIGAYLLVSYLPAALAEADDDVMQGFSVTVMYSFFSVPIQLALGLALAVLLFQKIRAKSLFRMIYFLPYITPFVATSAAFGLIFSHRSGSPANRLMELLGIPVQTWLLEPTGIFQLIFGDQVPAALAGPGLALVVIIIYNIWVYAGYSAVIFLAGLGNIPPELYEAARIDGASSWKQFRHVTLPLLSPTTFFLILIATIGTFQAFTQVFLLRRSGAYDAVDTINIYIYNEIQTGNPDYAYGSAMAFVLFAVILVLTLIQNRIVGRRVFYG